MGRPLVLAVVLLAGAGIAAAAPRAHAPAPKGHAQPTLPVLTAKQLFRRLDRAHAAHRPVVVHFWATWCPPCVKELPRILKAAPAWRRRAQVLLLAVVQPKDAPLARKLSGSGPGRFRLDADDPGAVAARLDSSWNGALPATFVLDGQGKVAYRVIGPFDGKAVDRALGIPRAR